MKTRLWRASHRRWRRWFVVRPALVLLAAAAFLALPGDVSAGEPGLQWSRPAANERLESSPSEIRLRFDAPVDVHASDVRVLDRSGATVVSTMPSAEDDGFELMLPLEADLAEDAYSVFWSVTEAEGEASSSGIFTFAVGGGETLASPPPESQLGQVPGWLASLSRSAVILGSTAAAGLLLVWVTSLRPVLRRAEMRPQQLTSRIRLISYLSLLLAGVGVVTGIVEALGRTNSSLSYLLTETSTGRSHVLQLIYLILFFALLRVPAVWRLHPGWRVPALVTVVAGTMLVPLAMSSQAGNQMVGAGPAVANQWVHLLGVSVWLGGLALVGIVAADGASIWRNPAVRGFLRRLAFLIAISIPILAVTGLYAFQLNTGNVNVLRSTDYGEVLTVKLVLSGLAILCGVFVLLFWWFRSSQSYVRPMTGLVVAVTLLIAAGVISQAGHLGVQERTARDAYQAASERQSYEFAAGDLHGNLTITPGVAGFNRVTLDLWEPDTRLSDVAQIAVRARPGSLPEAQRQLILFPEEICTSDGEVIVSPIERFESNGLDLGLAGEWDLDVVVQRVDQASVLVPVSVILGESASDADGLSPPLRFTGLQATLAFLTGAGALVIGGIAFVWRRAGAQNADFFALFSLVLVVFTFLAMWNGRITHTPEAQARNPVARTASSVEIGRTVFLEHCATCHGDDARGDGELARQLERPPADLTAPHLDTHPAGDIAYWIKYGIDPAMPGLKSELTDAEVWHLVNYLRDLRHPVDQNL